MTSRVAIAAACAAAVVLAGCAAIPDAPSPLPSDYVPSVSVEDVEKPGNLAPDGFSAAQRMTVRVRNVTCRDLQTGTGFAYDAHTLVTNRHVVENTRKLEVTTYDGRTISVTAASVAAVADLAVITTEEAMSAGAVLAQEDPIEGDAITVVGYPNGGKLTTVSGVVLGSTADPLGTALGQVLATTAPVQPGSSGSPVLNERGEVVGVIYAKNEAEQSFMVPVSMLRTLLDEEQLLVPQQQSCDNS
ncbi:serine protease [Demequina sp. TTPB684]|uniref:S1 family peptidase n=1 Tax=unclassified Demequina TaxID=2620311 RepID=UPI001CF356C9|nr:MULTISPECIES: serine protease [unclassified Demequina]MCB2412593.1 serine protease [Demequina sp. TTPB684]UPU89540.1 serine protease [Demequina sp. TMPB413]